MPFSLQSPPCHTVLGAVCGPSCPVRPCSPFCRTSPALWSEGSLHFLLCPSMIPLGSTLSLHLDLDPNKPQSFPGCSVRNRLEGARMVVVGGGLLAVAVVWEQEGGAPSQKMGARGSVQWGWSGTWGPDCTAHILPFIAFSIPSGVIGLRQSYKTEDGGEIFIQSLSFASSPVRPP